MDKSKLSVELVDENIFKENNLDRTIYGLNEQIKILTPNCEKYDYLLSISSGVLCSLIDIIFIKEFDLAGGRQIADDKINDIVIKVAKSFGCKSNDIKKCVAYLEEKFPIPADGNTPNFGGGLQHHLRDFEHHPTIMGLIFSILTQFTGFSYGTDTNGNFISVAVPERSKEFIGKNITEKLMFGTFKWFFHLVSDIAGSSSTAGLAGGTGIPGPVLSLAKEISALPFFKNCSLENNKEKMSISLFLQKLFNGTLLAKYDENGIIIKDSIIKLDFRGELGGLLELGKQSLPVLANECIVRGFYFIRHLALEMQKNEVKSFKDFYMINFNNIKLCNNHTINRMITISSSIFTTIDVSKAVISKKYFIAVNYVGVGRFAMAINNEIKQTLKIRNIKEIQLAYKNIRLNTYRKINNNIYERIGESMNFDKLGLTVEQTEILYNLEAIKVQNDIICTTVKKIKDLKIKWLNEWKKNIEIGFADFVQDGAAKICWFSEGDLIKKIKEMDSNKIWFRLCILEGTLFEPYYPMSIEKDKNGKEVISKKYSILNKPLIGFDNKKGDAYLEYITFLVINKKGYINRFRKCYEKSVKELSESNKIIINKLKLGVILTLAAIIVTAIFAPQIAVILVGSQFTGLSGAALTSACLAYLGGGAIAAGGLGITGGTAVIVGGGALLGTGISAGVGGSYGYFSLRGKKETIRDSAKLITATREIFLNDEKDVEYSTTIYEQYVDKIREAENTLTEIKLKENIASQSEKKKLEKQVKNAEESIKTMRIAMKSMNKFNSSFKIGLDAHKKE